MTLQRSFKFVDSKLNQKTISLIKKAGIPCRIDKKGLIHYSALNEKKIENDLIRLVRDSVFSRWAILFCPRSWVERYKKYMLEKEIMFYEELIDGELCFLIPARHRPHQWKLE